MTTPQAQGKGRKKNKESTKLSLEEFNSFDAPHGHNVVSIKTTGLDWAETMAEQVIETQQVLVPTAPRSQRGPAVDFDSLPDTGPFRISVFNVPLTSDEKELQDRVFKDLDVVRVMSDKSCTTVELGSKTDLYEALSKDGVNFKGRTLNVLLYGQQPPNNYGSDRRGGNNSYGDRYADRDRGFGASRSGGRYGDRQGGFGDRQGGFGDRQGGFGDRQGGFGDRQGGFGDRQGGFGDRQGGFGDRQGGFGERPGGFSRDRDSSYGGFSRGGYGQPRGGGYNNDRFSDRPMDRFNDRPVERFNDRPIERSIERSEQRQKLDLKKRTTPLNLDDVSRNEAIFGQAKPSSKPYEKLMEIEEKLKGKE